MPPPRSEALAALGSAIRETRKESGYTQEGFAIKSGIDRSYYGAIERGEHNLTVANLLKVATGLDVPAWELLRRAGM